MNVDCDANIFSIPLELRDGVEKFSACKMFDRNYSELARFFVDKRFNENFINHEHFLDEESKNYEIVNCQHGWVFDRTMFSTTVISEV